jgi:hypothetical protein
MKNITLKKVNLNEALSEETPCFSADVYENGKLIAHISNRGHGGCNEVRPAKGLKYDDVKHLDTIDAECEINTMVEEINIVKRNQSKSFVLKKDNKIFTRKFKHSFAQMKKKLPDAFPNWIKKEKNELKAKGYIILNTNI